VGVGQEQQLEGRRKRGASSSISGSSVSGLVRLLTSRVLSREQQQGEGALGTRGSWNARCSDEV
jgi:hypothetical protein